MKILKPKSLCRALGMTIALCFPVLGQALCVQGDGAGTWIAHGVMGDTLSREFEETMRCKIDVNAAGTIIGSTSSCLMRDDRGLDSINIAWGGLTINSSCGVTGIMRMCDSGVCETAKIEYGTVSRSKDSVTITGYMQSDPDYVFFLQAVKR